METLDYNGDGKWSAAEIRSRYIRYAAEARISPRDLAPVELTAGGLRRVDPVMERVIEGIEAGDPACIRIGIEFIQEDRGFPFGMPLKSKTARTLRRVSLKPQQKRQILHRVFDMLKRGYVPREYSEYAKLARHIGFGVADVPDIENANPYAAKYRRYFIDAASPVE
jgi:hypothetical protein